MSFADELKSARKRLNLTQVEMATLLDVPPRVYWDMEQGVEHYAITKEGARARIAAAGRAAGAGGAPKTRRTKTGARK
jgi:transcriptional regulator with XRE-family HTH domain